MAFAIVSTLQPPHQSCTQNKRLTCRRGSVWEEGSQQEKSGRNEGVGMDEQSHRALYMTRNYQKENKKKTES